MAPHLRTALFGAGQRPLRRQLAITLAAIFGGSIVISMLLLNLLFGVQASQLIDQRSQFFMDAMLAVRSYTSQSVNPIIAPLNEGPGIFRPEAVPSYSAQTVFAGLKAKDDYRNYSYREAALNPTNLRDKADSFETSIIDQFRANKSLKVLSGDKSTPLGSVHYVARPIQVTKESCLTCHSTPQRAPASQLRAYGDSSGFGWKLDEIVGTQISRCLRKLFFRRRIASGSNRCSPGRDLRRCCRDDQSSARSVDHQAEAGHQSQGG